MLCCVCIFLACFLCCIIYTCIFYFLHPCTLLSSVAMLWSDCKQDMLQNSNLFGNSSMRRYDLYSFGVCFLFVFFLSFFVSSKRFFKRSFFPWACWLHVLNKFCFHLAHPSLFVPTYLSGVDKSLGIREKDIGE